MPMKTFHNVLDVNKINDYDSSWKKVVQAILIVN